MTLTMETNRPPLTANHEASIHKGAAKKHRLKHRLLVRMVMSFLSAHKFSSKLFVFFLQSPGCPLSPSGSVRSPYSSLSLTASMQLVDEILSDQRIEKMDKIERLEAILSAATASSPSSIALSSSELSSSCCNCDCHSTSKYVMQRDSLSGRYLTEVGCQTLSTGDIVITKVYFPEGDTSASDICLTPSPKKTKPAQFQ